MAIVMGLVTILAKARSLTDWVKEIIIMDFNRSRVLSESEMDQELIRDEKVRIGEMLEMAVSKRDIWEFIPKETRKLLS